MPLNTDLILPLTPGLYEMRVPSRTVRLIDKFTDMSAKDPQSGQPAPKERWRGELDKGEGLKIYELDGSYVAMNGVQSMYDLKRRIGD